MKQEKLFKVLFDELKRESEEYSLVMFLSEKIPCEVKFSAASYSRFSELLRLYRKRNASPDEIKELSGLLQSMLPQSFWTQIDESLIIELSCKNSIDLVTNIPWELASTSQNQQNIFANSVARYKIARVIQHSCNFNFSDSRLKVLTCITSPDSGKLKIKPETLATAFENVFRPYPMVIHRMLGKDKIFPNVFQIAAEVDKYDPNIMILVAHGDSDSDNPQGSQVLLGDQWVAVTELATALAKSGNLILCILLCCDLARRPQASVSTSAAIKLLQSGIPEVIAMQGDIEVGCATAFIEGLLKNLLAYGNSIEAVVAGRKSAQNHSDVFKPALFINKAYEQHYYSTYLTLQKYKIQLATLFANSFPMREFFLRETVAVKMRALLLAKGFRFITSGVGCGATESIQAFLKNQIVSTNEVLPGPIYYIDMRLETRVASVKNLILNRLNRYPALLINGQILPNKSLEELMFDIDDSQIILMIDNIDAAADEEEQEYWRNLLNHSDQKQNSLTVLINPPHFLNCPGSKMAFHVSPLESKEETKAYLEAIHPKHAAAFDSVHQFTNGIPFFIEAEIINLGRAKPKANSNMTAYDTYLASLKQQLSGESYQLLFELTLFKEGTSAEIIYDCTTIKLKESLDELVHHAVVFKFNRENQEYYVVNTPAKVILLQQQNEMVAAAKSLTNLFSQKFHGDHDVAKKIIKLPGGFALLEALQHAYDLLANKSSIVNIAFFSIEPGAYSSAVWRLWENAYKMASDAMDIEMRVQMADIAVAIAKHSMVEKLLEIDTKTFRPTIDLGDDDFLFCKTLKILSAYLKDRWQHQYISIINQSYDMAVDICKEHIPIPQFNGAKDWLDLYAEILNNRIAFELFLNKPDLEKVLQDLDLLKEITNGGLVYGYSCCELAEFIMKSASPDWNKILGYLLEAKKITENSHDERFKSYCYYQYAQALRKGTNPDIPAAAQWYEQAAKAGKIAGEGRREAIALFRSAQIGYEYNMLTIEQAAAKLDEATRPLYETGDDSFSVRIIKMITRLRATIEGNLSTGKAEKYFSEACNYAAYPQLTGTSDRIDFKNLFVDYLSFLKRRDMTASAHDFLHKHQNRLQKEGIQVDFSNPWSLIHQIQNLN